MNGILVVVVVVVVSAAAVTTTKINVVFISGYWFPKYAVYWLSAR
jgi:hypothetical protein